MKVLVKVLALSWLRAPVSTSPDPSEIATYPHPHQAERLAESLERAALGILVATLPENVAYMTGFHPVIGTADRAQVLSIFTRHGIALVAPIALAAALVDVGLGVERTVYFGTADGSREEPLVPSPAKALAVAFERLGVRGSAVGLDESGLTHEAWVRLTEDMSDVSVTPAAGSLAEARRVKGPYEIECLIRALSIAEEALNAVIQTLDRGMTEAEAAKAIATEIVRGGAWPRPPVVGIGERTAILASRPGDVALRPGDLMRLDVGCSYKGYCGSVGRTAILGEPSARQERAYRAVQSTIEAATAAVSVGKSGAIVFDRSREAFQASGLERAGLDHIGHGIGLEPCERPQLASGSDSLLELGEVLYLEAAYVEPSAMGVSVSDTVLVTRTGARVLNRSDHGLVVLD